MTLPQYKIPLKRRSGQTPFRQRVWKGGTTWVVAGYWLGLLALTPSSLSAAITDGPVTYRVRFRGLSDRALAREVRAVSNLQALRRRPPASLRQLERRVESDRQRIQDLLRTHGYYQSTIQARLDAARQPVRIRLTIDPGPQYLFRDIRIHLSAPDEVIVPLPPPDQLNLRTGQPALAREVVRLDDQLVRFFAHHGYPFARVVQREVRVEHRAHAMDVHVEDEPGPRARFGTSTFHGVQTVDVEFLRQKLPWSVGERYDGEKIRMGQRRLMNADLFSIARVRLAESPAEDGTVPLQIEVQERRHRSITLGGGYQSDEGARARLGWEHRNVFGRGERVHLLGTVSGIGFGGMARLRIPDWQRADQNLTLTLRAARDEPDAYRSRHGTALLQLDRPLGRGLTGSLGSGYRYVDVEQAGIGEYFGLIYFPATLERDRSDDLLDPRNGWRWTTSAAPYRDLLDSGVTFFKVRGALTGYTSPTPQQSVTLAGRLVVATMGGATRDAIPADERYYAGGGGSIRGYPYQSVGPLTDDAEPLGGKSITLLSTEIRWRWTRTLGLVAFGDGGMVYTDSDAGDWSDWLWGAGLGLRYFTPIGPLRLDVAVPLDRRSEIDDAFQFYISLGQAF